VAFANIAHFQKNRNVQRNGRSVLYLQIGKINGFCFLYRRQHVGSRSRRLLGWLKSDGEEKM
jgi:hypothetical protein